MKPIQPTITIAVPIYNAAETITRTLDSLQKQTLQGFEVIAIDDGSTDDTADILAAYNWERPEKLIRIYQEDIGQAKTMNFALELASGEYFAELDSDDFADSRMYKTLYDEAKRTDADVVKCNTVEHYKQGPQLVKHMQKITPGEVYCLRDIQDRKQKRDAFVRYNHLMSGIAKTDFLKRNNIHYRPGFNFEDTAVCFKIRALADRYVYVNEYLYNYNRNNPGSGTNTIKDVFGIIDQVHEIYRFNEEHGLKLEEYIALEELYCYKWNLQRLTLEETELFTERIAKEVKAHDIGPDLFPVPFDEEFYNFLKRF